MSEQPDRCSYPHFTNEGVQKSHKTCLRSNSSLHAPGSVRTWALQENHRLQTRRPLGDDSSHPPLISDQSWLPPLQLPVESLGGGQTSASRVATESSELGGFPWVSLYASVSHVALIGISLLWASPSARGAQHWLCPNPFHRIQGHGDWWYPWVFALPWEFQSLHQHDEDHFLKYGYGFGNRQGGRQQGACPSALGSCP